MRHLIFAVALMTGLIWSGPGQAKTGNDLYEFCTAGKISDKFLVCIGYVDGVIDTLYFHTAAVDYNICSPSNVTLGQMLDVVKKWLTENPEKRHLEAPVTVINALSKAWPCPKKKP